jgi:hypothetical protein
MHPRRLCFGWVLVAACVGPAPTRAAEGAGPFTISWAEHFLTIHGARLPGGRLKVHYLEAYCRAGSTDRDWRRTVIPHRSELVSRSADGRSLKLRDRLADGVVVRHEVVASGDGVAFRVVATNPTTRASEAHWAQPCIRVDTFTGRGQKDYLPLCFVFLDGRLARLPTRPWAEKARYTPGQVYRPRGVDRQDVNPRPLSPLVPSNGLIGCFSGDGKLLLASAWEPYQELFQGVVVCVHSDFRIGGLRPGETKKIRGKIYVLPADVGGLLRRYERDFPEHRPKKKR